MDARKALSDLIFGHFWARAVQVAARLGIADHVRDGARTTDALARATDIDAWRMGRFVRVLVALGLLRKNGAQLELTEMGRLLCSDEPGTLRNIALLNYHSFTAWTELERVLRTKESGYKLSTGLGYFEAVQQMPDFAEAFDLAMNDMFVPETLALIEKYDFGQYGFLMDVGGGNGEVLIRALKAHPHLSGCLFDLPHVVDRAASRIAGEGVGDRCERYGGSFFDSLPRKAEAILVRHILHDWQEEEAVRILRRCREALEPGGVVLISEAIIEDAETVTLPLRLDLAMMTLYDGAERTLEEYRELAARAGLAITGVVPITPALSVMEARAR